MTLKNGEKAGKQVYKNHTKDDEFKTCRWGGVHTVKSGVKAAKPVYKNHTKDDVFKACGWVGVGVGQ